MSFEVDEAVAAPADGDAPPTGRAGMTAAPDGATGPADGSAPPARPPYRISYTVSVDSLVDAARLAHSGTRNRILLLAAAAAVVGLAFLVLAPTGSGLVLVFFGVAMTLLLVLRAPERWFVGRRAGSVIGTPVRFVVDDDGIEAMTPAATGRLAWSGLTDVRADERAVVFVSGRVMASGRPPTPSARRNVATRSSPSPGRGSRRPPGGSDPGPRRAVAAESAAGCSPRGRRSPTC